MILCSRARIPSAHASLRGAVGRRLSRDELAPLTQVSRLHSLPAPRDEVILRLAGAGPSGPASPFFSIWSGHEREAEPTIEGAFGSLGQDLYCKLCNRSFNGDGFNFQKSDSAPSPPPRQHTHIASDTAVRHRLHYHSAQCHRSNAHHAETPVTPLACARSPRKPTSPPRTHVTPTALLRASFAAARLVYASSSAPQPLRASPGRVAVPVLHTCTCACTCGRVALPCPPAQHATRHVFTRPRGLLPRGPPRRRARRRVRGGRCRPCPPPSAPPAPRLARGMAARPRTRRAC